MGVTLRVTILLMTFTPQVARLNLGPFPPLIVIIPNSFLFLGLFHIFCGLNIVSTPDSWWSQMRFRRGFLLRIDFTFCLGLVMITLLNDVR